MNPIYKPKGAAAHIEDSLRAEMERRIGGEPDA